jgi:hypothetical protein
MRRTVLARGERLPRARRTSTRIGAGVARILDGDRLKSIPGDAKKRLIVLEWLVEQFDREMRYPESMVNEIIKRHHWIALRSAGN